MRKITALRKFNSGRFLYEKETTSFARLHSDVEDACKIAPEAGLETEVSAGQQERESRTTQERPTNNKTKWRRLIAKILVRAGSLLRPVVRATA